MILAVLKYDMKIVGVDFEAGCIFHGQNNDYYFTQYDFVKGETCSRLFKPQNKKQVDVIISLIITENNKTND